MKFAPNLGERLQIHAKQRRETTPWGELWNVGMGRYSHPLFLSEQLTPHRHERELVGIEQRLHDQLLAVRKQRDNAGSNDPAILLDFGGMLGLSMARLAAQPDIHPHLETGRLIIVVTNLSLNIDEALRDDVQKKRHDQISPAELALIREQKPWIQYVQGDAAQIRRTTITLPSGQPLPLQEHVDIIHECFTLIHGVKNDMDIPRLGKLLSDYGSLWMSSGISVTSASQMDTQTEAEANLAELGIKPIDLGGRKAGYKIFTKSSAIVTL